MNPESIEQNQSSDARPNTANKTPVETLILSENLSPAEIKHLLGTAFFNENALLVLHIEGISGSLTIKPTPKTFIGRSEDSSPECLHVDLTPYGAKEKGVSRLHVILYRTLVTISLEDLNSTNRTYVNGVMMPTRQVQMLHDGDEIMLGALRIRIAFQYG
jgi:pSer/pThr/pTyr-binding forkhead associated (FHA) protein